MTRIEIPIYDPDSEVEYDCTKRYPLTLQEAEGLRIIMGELDDEDAPDVLIERAVGMWRIFVHPNSGDPLCIVEIREDRAAIQDESGELLLEQTLR